jgi:hypothetical protein
MLFHNATPNPCAAQVPGHALSPHLPQVYGLPNRLNPADYQVDRENIIKNLFKNKYL